MPDAEEVCRANKQSVDRWLTVSHWAERVCIVLVLVVSVVSYSVAQARSVVDRIIIEGNRRVATESLQALIHTHIGDTYNQSALQRDFKALWDAKNFSDIRLEVRGDPDHADAKIVYFILVEKPAK